LYTIYKHLKGIRFYKFREMVSLEGALNIKALHTFYTKRWIWDSKKSREWERRRHDFDIIQKGKKDNITHNTNGEEWPQKEIIRIATASEGQSFLNT
jgi:hypothetical protein